MLTIHHLREVLDHSNCQSLRIKIVLDCLIAWRNVVEKVVDCRLQTVVVVKTGWSYCPDLNSGACVTVEIGKLSKQENFVMTSAYAHLYERCTDCRKGAGMTLQVRGSTREFTTCIFPLSGRKFNQFVLSIINNEIIYQLKGLVCKETVELRR